MIVTRLCALLGIRHPILNAPMSGTAGAALAAAVSEAGGFGMIGGTTQAGPEWLREQIREVRAKTDRPFGVGFISSFPGLNDLVEVAIEERVAAIGHSFADPTPYVATAHAAGIKVLVQVQTVAQAKVAAQAGADAITAQGTEAGGHTGHSGTLPIVLAVIDAVAPLSVLAAGGIADGRGTAAALMLGAEGIWMGTRFVASREGMIAEWAKQRVVEAGTDDTILTKVYDTIAQSAFPPTIGDRVLRNDFTAAWHGRIEQVAERRETLQRQIRDATEARDARVAPVRAGNASGLIHSVEPAAEIIRRIVSDAEALLRTRPGQVLAAD